MFPFDQLGELISNFTGGTSNQDQDQVVENSRLNQPQQQAAQREDNVINIFNLGDKAIREYNAWVANEDQMRQPAADGSEPLVAAEQDMQVPPYNTPNQPQQQQQVTM